MIGGNLQIARILGIPIIINVTWLITFVFVTSLLALRVYPELLPDRYRDDRSVHWLMAGASGVSFAISILLHELAHSIVARLQGIPVRSITFFALGGVSQIAGEARRPLNEFTMAVVGPLMSVLLAGVFFLLWVIAGFGERRPIPIMFEWLCLMNLILGAFNMAPGFPMDGGRVVRAALWAISRDFYRATRWATLLGRGLGYSLMFIGLLGLLGVLTAIGPWSGLWFGFLGLYLEQSARQSWIQTRALHSLSRYSAEDIMSSDIETADSSDLVRYVLNRAGRRFIFFISDAEDRVIGVLTEKEVEALGPERGGAATAGDLMVPTQNATVAAPREDAASLLQTMEAGSLWHLPVVAEGRVIGVVSKESILRLLARSLTRREPASAGAGPR